MSLKSKYNKALNKCKQDAFNVHCITEQGVWLGFYPLNDLQIPNQGWKIHISISISQCLDIFVCPIPYLLENQIAFKIPISLEKIIAINSGHYGESQIGKIITIYPANLNILESCVKFIKTNINITPGPCIPSDIRLSKNSPIYFRFGSFLGKQYNILENGLKEYYLLDNNNGFVKERRTTNSEQPSFAPVLPFKTLHNEGHYTQNVNSFRKYFIPVSILYKSFKSDITVGLHIGTGNVLIQKRAFSKIGEDINGRDNTNYLENEFYYLKLLHELINCPKPYSFKRLSDYSVIYEEFIDGISLEEADVLSCSSIFILLLQQIAILNNFGVLHNDIKPTNVLIANSKVYLTDFEIAQHINDTHRNYGGTRGYMIVKNRSNLYSKADLYAFCICLAGHLLSIDNSRLLLSLRQILKLLKLYGYFDAVYVINKLYYSKDCINYKEVEFHLDNINVQRKCRPSNNYLLKQWFRKAIYDQLCLTKKDFYVSETLGYWQTTDTSLSNSDINFGINTGNSGTLIGLVIISKNLNTDILNDEIEKCCISLLNFESALPLGLFSGRSGIAIALIISGLYLEKAQYVKYGLSILARLPDIQLSADLFNGQSSILFALCKAFELTRCDSLAEQANIIYGKIVNSFNIIENVYVWPHNNEAFTGAAHGSAGIGMTLIYYSKIFCCDLSFDIGVLALKSIYRKSVEEKLDSIIHDLYRDNGQAPVLGWCHGVEGYLWCLIYNREYLDYFKEEIDWCISKIVNQKIISNPSICHGLAGRFELWNQIASIEQYKQIAENKIMEILSILRIVSIKKKGKTTWYSDEAGEFNHDLWVGSLGVSAVVSNYLNNRTESII